MEVVLLKDLSFGDKGNIIKVKSGYARNYLLPLGLALVATAKNIKHIKQLEAQQKSKLLKEKEEIEKSAKKINEHAPIIVKAKAGENGVLFGSVTHAQITEAINNEFKLNLDKKRVLVKNIRQGGLTEVPLKLTFGISAIAKIEVELIIEKTKAEDKPKAKKLRGKKTPEENAQEKAPENEETQETATATTTAANKEIEKEPEAKTAADKTEATTEKSKQKKTTAKKTKAKKETKTAKKTASKTEK